MARAVRWGSAVGRCFLLELRHCAERFRSACFCQTMRPVLFVSNAGFFRQGKRFFQVISAFSHSVLASAHTAAGKTQILETGGVF